jgi:hypothetical protein
MWSDGVQSARSPCRVEIGSSTLPHLVASFTTLLMPERARNEASGIWHVAAYGRRLAGRRSQSDGGRDGEYLGGGEVNNVPPAMIFLGEQMKRGIDVL